MQSIWSPQTAPVPLWLVKLGACFMPSRVTTREDEEKGWTPWVCLSMFVEVVPIYFAGIYDPISPTCWTWICCNSAEVGNITVIKNSPKRKNQTGTESEFCPNFKMQMSLSLKKRELDGSCWVLACFHRKPLTLTDFCSQTNNRPPFPGLREPSSEVVHSSVTMVWCQSPLREDLFEKKYYF